MAAALRLLKPPLSKERIEEISFAVAEMGFYKLGRGLHRLAGLLEGEPSAQGLAPPPEAVAVAAARVKLEPSQEDLELMLNLFSGREGVFAEERIDSMGVRSFRRIDRPLTVSDLREHIEGKRTLGVYLLRVNNTVNFAVIDIDVSRKLMLTSDREEIEEMLAKAHGDALRILSAASKLGVSCYIEDSGHKGRHCWFFFERPVKGETAREFLRRIAEEAGQPSPGINWELFPQQVRVRPEQVGQLIKLPLGVHSKSKRRSLFLDESGMPVEDQFGLLRSVEPIPLERVERIVGISRRVEGVEDEGWIEEMFEGMPLVIKVVSGCSVVRFLVKKARDTNWLAHHERLLLLRTLGHLGDEGKKALHLIMSHTLNYSERITDRFINKLEPYPISCARVRGNYPELTASLNCSCRFRLPPGAYPSPVLHALDAEEVPAMRERAERKAEAAEEGAAELRERAESLVQKLSELRRHLRGIQSSIERCERELRELFESHGVEEIELSIGVLRMVKDGDEVRWVIEI